MAKRAFFKYYLNPSLYKAFKLYYYEQQAEKILKMGVAHETLIVQDT